LKNARSYKYYYIFEKEEVVVVYRFSEERAEVPQIRAGFFKGSS